MQRPETSANDGDTRTWSYGKRWAILGFHPSALIITQVKRGLGIFASAFQAISSHLVSVIDDYD